MLNINGNIIVNGALTVQPGANIKVLSGKILKVY
jgi:hypothetical protein